MGRAVMKTLVLITSLTGNTKTFLNYIKKHTKGELVICDDLSFDFEGYSKIIIGSYTWSDGKIPIRMKKYLVDNYLHLKDKEVFIFGSGNSIYPHFCGAVDGIQKIVSDSGATVIGTFKFEQRFKEEDFSNEELDNLERILQDWNTV